MSLLERITELETLPPAQIRKIWTDVFGVSSPAVEKDLLVLSVAYRMQEEVYGGLSRRQKRQLDRSAAALCQTGRLSNPAPIRLPVGTHLVREWHGKTYHVTVKSDRFMFNGSEYRSLTQIAREITGCSWPGPDFFGLRSRKSQSRAVSARE